MSRRWYALFQLDAYAINFDFDEPVNEATARKRMVRWAFGSRTRKRVLPKGTQVWMGQL